MPARICDACGLKNPATAVMCDCGQQLRAVDSKTLAAAQVANRHVRSNKVAVGVGIGAALILLLILVRFAIRAWASSP